MTPPNLTGIDLDIAIARAREREALAADAKYNTDLLSTPTTGMSREPEESGLNQFMDEIGDLDGWANSFMAAGEGALELGKYAATRNPMTPTGMMRLGEDISNLEYEDVVNDGVGRAATQITAGVGGTLAGGPGVGLGLATAAGPAYDAARGKSGSEIGENLRDDLAGELLTLGLFQLPKGFKASTRRGQQVLHKVTGKTHRDITDFEFKKKQGALTDVMAGAKLGKTDIHNTQRLMESEPYFLRENLTDGVVVNPDFPDEALNQLGHNYQQRLNSYRRMEQVTLQAAEDAAEQAGMPPIRINEMFNEALEQSPNLEGYISEMQFEGMPAMKVIQADFTPTQAKELLLKVQEELRSEKWFEARMQNDGSQAAKQAKLQMDKKIDALDNLQLKLREKIDNYTSEAIEYGRNNGMIDKGEVPDIGFNEINKRRHHLLHYEGILPGSKSPDISAGGPFAPFPRQVPKPGEFRTTAMGGADQLKIRQGETPGLDYQKQLGAAPIDPRYIGRHAGQVVDYAIGDSPAARLQRSAIEAEPRLIEDIRGIEAASPELNPGAPGPKPYSPAPGEGFLDVDPMAMAAAGASMLTTVEPAPLPRDPAILFKNPEYLDRMRGSVSRDTFVLIQQAVELEDPIALRNAFGRMFQEAPDLFEPGIQGYRSALRVGNGFVLSDPQEALVARQRIGGQMERGEVPSTWAFEQIQSFKNPNDMRVIARPEQREQFKKQLDIARGNVKPPPIQKLIESNPGTSDTTAGERRRYADEPSEGSSLGKPSKDMSYGEVTTALKQRGYSSAAIAGILGNIDVETGGSFDYKQKQHGGGKGRGLFQFDFMDPYYRDWLSKKSFDDSLDAQIEFMDGVVKGDIPMLGTSERKRLLDVLTNSTDPAEVAEVFMEVFEKPGVPHTDKRISAAKKYFNLVG